MTQQSSKRFISATGIDFHKFADEADRECKNNFIMIGGIQIQHKFKIQAHSDGDVLLHSLVDAILGTICMGDIGTHFSDKDEKWKNAPSSIFVKHAIDLLSRQSGKLIHIDSTIICQEPKILPYRYQITQKILTICNIPELKVNIKGKTTEEMGFLGRGEGIAAITTCTVEF